LTNAYTALMNTVNATGRATKVIRSHAQDVKNGYVNNALLKICVVVVSLPCREMSLDNC
jgi:hypothetical protein